MVHRFPEPIDHVYILCHPEKEPERYAYLSSWLKAQDIDPTQVSLGVATYGSDPFFQTRDVWRLYDPWTTQHGRRVQNFNSKNLKPAELSLIWNFAAVAKAAVAAQHSVVLILESDVLFCEDFLKRLGEALKNLKDQQIAWDFLSLSASADLRPVQVEPGRLWFPPNHPYLATRCTDSMIFRVPLLAKISNTLFPCAEALDWELNFQLALHGARCWWLDPPVIRQGSGREYRTTL